MILFEVPAEKIIAVLDQLNLMALIIICLVIGIGLTATVLAARANWSNIADEFDLVVTGTKSWRRFLLGFINGPIIFILSAIFFKSGHPLLGLITLTFLFSLIVMGMMGEMALLGRRALVLHHPTSTLFGQTIAGGLIITAIFFLPILGQVIFFLLLFRSIGATIYWFFKRKSLRV